MSDHEPLSIQELKKRIGYRLGWRSLLRYLEAIELAKKVKFIDRSKKRGLTRFRVTLAAVEVYAPELTGKVPAKVTAHVGLREAQEFLQSLDERIADSTAEAFERRVAPRLERLERRVGIGR